MIFFAFGLGVSSTGYPVTAAAGRLDDKDVSGRELSLVGAGQRIAVAGAAFDPLTTTSAVRPAVEPKRSDVAAGRDDDGGHRFEKTDAPHRAVAAAPASRAAGPAADRKRF